MRGGENFQNFINFGGTNKLNLVEENSVIDLHDNQRGEINQ